MTSVRPLRRAALAAAGLTAAFAAALDAAAGAAAPLDADVLTIGVLLPQTGEGSPIGLPGTVAAESAVAAINRADVFDQPVRLLKADEGSTIDEARAGLEELLDEEVDAVVGPASSLVTLEILGDLMDAGIITCSPTATAIALDDYPNRSLFFRTVPSDSQAANGIAVQAARTGVTAATVVYLDDAFGRPYAREVISSLRDRNIDVTAELPLDVAAAELSEEAATLAESETGTIIVIADADHGQLMLNALAEVLVDPPRIIVNDAMRNAPAGEVADWPAAFRDAIEGVSPLGTPQTEDEPTGPFATNAFDCVNLIALASLAAASDDPDDVAAQIRPVANDGFGCATFADCAATIAAGRDVDYNGPRGRLTLATDGDPAPPWLAVFRFAESGLAENTGLVRPNE